MQLKIASGNAKLKKLEQLTGKTVYHISLLSGHSCPFAKECKSKAIRKNGKTTIQDGPHTVYRCFSASQEVIFPEVYNTRKYNFDNLKKPFSKMVDNISQSLPNNDSYIMRIHVGGDFFNENYFKAWLKIAQDNPQSIFYAYTKSLPYWLNNRKEVTRTKNFVLTASYGGTHDSLIKRRRLRYVKVVMSENEAKKLNLPIDHDDSLAYNPLLRKQNFALLIHGIQPAGSEASKAVVKLRGNGSYSRNKK